jgi:penicillin-binding protein 1A
VLPLLMVAFAGVLLFFYFFTQIPLPDTVGARPTVLLDANGAELGTLQAETSREDVDLDELPEHVKQAVLAAEDAGFYEHRGVSVLGIFRAALRNVAAREVSQGGSTISQQYVKTVTSDDERTLLRKAREAALAVKLERQYSKDQILEFYLNSIYWGRGAYGIEAASKAYFRKSASKLTDAQAALLAGIIAAPSAYDPSKNPDAAAERYEYVLGRMVTNRWMDPARAGELAAQVPATRKAAPVSYKEAPFFLEMVREELQLKLGEDANIFNGLIVTTTLDKRMQDQAEEVYKEAFVDSGIEPGGAMVAIDNSTGGISALVGGKNYADSQLNLAMAARQPGSTFKPFALAAWIAEGNSPDSYFDAPAQITFSREELNQRLGITSSPDDWEPSNFENAEYGSLSLREATHKSVNTVYAQVILEVGPKEVRRMAERAGVKSPLAPTPSLVLGTSEVTPLEMAQAYSTFANGGVLRKAHTVAEVRQGGDVIHRTPTKGDDPIDRNVALTVTDVLEGVITSGSGINASIGRPAAGKTGTTQNNADAWFAGYTPQYTAVVWMGNVENNQPMAGEYTGGSLPAETWGAFMERAHEGLPVEQFPPPSLDGLEVVNPSPAPEPAACGDGEVATEDPSSSEGAQICVQTEPTETEAPTEDPAEAATEEPAATEAPEPDEEPEPDQEPEPEPEPTDEQPDAEPTEEAPEPEPPPEVEPTEDAEPNRGRGRGDDDQDQDAADAA